MVRRGPSRGGQRHQRISRRSRTRPQPTTTTSPARGWAGCPRSGWMPARFRALVVAGERPITALSTRRGASGAAVGSAVPRPV